jgi:DeoR/GlpR family transcriptional regulator of sugar metabolism
MSKSKLVEAQILKFIAGRGRVSRKELLERFSYMSPRTVRGYTKRLVDKGQVSRVKVIDVLYCCGEAEEG